MLKKICEIKHKQDKKASAEKRKKVNLNLHHTTYFVVITTKNTAKTRAETRRLKKAKTMKFVKVLTKANVCATM